MLAALRSSISGILAKGLLAFLVLTFAVWGVGDMLNSSGSSWIVKVGDETISYPEFARNKSYIEQSLQAMGMSKVDPRALENDVLRRMVEQKLVMLRVKELGLQVGDELLAERVRTAPMFQGENGKFDPLRFKVMLQQRQMHETVFLDQLKDDLLTTALTTSMSMDGATLPDGYATLLAANEAQTRDVVLVTIPANSAVKIEDKDIEAYYESRKETLYMQPEQRSFSFISFDASQLRSMVDAKITEDELKERYELDKERFKSFEQAKATLRDELRSEYQDTLSIDLTNEIEDALAGGQSLEKAAQEAGINANVRTLKQVTDEQGANDLEKAVIARGFSLQEGETSSLETTADGTYYIVALDETTVATPKSLDAVKEDVRSRITKEQQSTAVRARASEVKKALEKNNDWKAVLQKENLNGQPIKNVARPAKGKNGALPALLQQAIFEHSKGGVAGPLTQANGSATLAVITAVHQPEVTPKKADSASIKTLNEEILSEYFSHLVQRYPVRVNEALLVQMRQTGQQ